MITIVEKEVLRLIVQLKPIPLGKDYQEMLEKAGNGKTLLAQYRSASSETPLHCYVTSENWEQVKCQPGLKVYAVPRSTD